MGPHQVEDPELATLRALAEEQGQTPPENGGSPPEEGGTPKRKGRRTKAQIAADAEALGGAPSGGRKNAAAGASDNAQMGFKEEIITDTPVALLLDAIAELKGAVKRYNKAVRDVKEAYPPASLVGRRVRIISEESATAWLLTAAKTSDEKEMAATTRGPVYRLGIERAE